MARDWEAVFTTWSQGPSATEQQKCENAEQQVRQAIANSEKLRDRTIRVFTQGSYRNRVNVRRDSDVDIGVLCYDTIFTDYTDDNVKARMEAEADLVPATYDYAVFKNELEAALVTRFGRASVTRGQKAFDITANTYRVEADVAPFFEHRRYTSGTRYHSGVEMLADGGSGIVNWPEQHYENGTSKNTATGRRFKRIVRVMKTLSNEMSAAGIESAERAPSFLIECLVWNTPDECLVRPKYTSAVRETLVHLFNSTLTDDVPNEWGEVSDLKYLFRGKQPWTCGSAHEFISDAWDYMGLE